MIKFVSKSRPEDRTLFLNTTLVKDLVVMFSYHICVSKQMFILYNDEPEQRTIISFCLLLNNVLLLYCVAK